jgi:hypothetical protein
MTTPSLHQFAVEAAAWADSMEAREQELALAAEQLSQDAAVQAAFKQGIQHERQRTLTLISIQQGQLSRGGLNALILEALRRQVQEVQP